MNHASDPEPRPEGQATPDLSSPFTYSTDVSPFTKPLSSFLASSSFIYKVVAGCMVFRRASTGNFELLLLRRAPSDSFALKWEIPAGTTDPSIDDSIAGAAMRELFEESGLRAKYHLCTVGLGIGKGKTITMVGEANDARMHPELNMCLLELDGRTWGVVTFISEIDDYQAKIALQHTEHVDWAWVTEAEVKKGEFERGKCHALEFVSEAMRMIVLEGFRLRNQIN